MKLTIVTKGQPYIFLEVDYFEVKAKKLSAEVKTNKRSKNQTYIFKEEETDADN